MCKATLTFFLTLSLKSINGESCLHVFRAPVTVTGLKTHNQLNFTLNLNVRKWNFFYKYIDDAINFVSANERESLKVGAVFNEDHPKSFYVSVAKDLKQCDLKSAISFTNNPTSGNSITMNNFYMDKSIPCVSIQSLPCRSEPTLSITYNIILNESAGSVNTITYSEATVVYCNGKSENKFKWYYDNDTEINKGRVINITESMAGANVYCAEIAPCDYGAIKKNCTLARSKIYTLDFVNKDRDVSSSRSILSGWIIYCTVALAVLVVSLAVWRVVIIRVRSARSKSYAAMEPPAPVVQGEQHSNQYEEIYDDVYELRRNQQRLIDELLKRPTPPPVETIPRGARRAPAASSVGATEQLITNQQEILLNRLLRSKCTAGGVFAARPGGGSVNRGADMNYENCLHYENCSLHYEN